MDITRTHYKDIDAYVVSDGALELTVSDYGAKLQSIRFHGKEYLVQNSASVQYRLSGYGDCFTEGEFSGFDDMFPNITAGLYVGGRFDGAVLPDHGEVWSQTWNHAITDEGVMLSVDGTALPYTLQKTVSISYPAITLDYMLTNRSDSAFEYIWAAHPLFILEKDTRLELPSVSEIINVFGGQRYLGSDGERHSWPVSNDGRDMSVLNPANRCQNKYYIENDREENVARIRYPGGTAVTLRATCTVPFLGVWVDEGVQMSCVAPEPCTGAYDTQERAHNSGRICRIEAHSSCRFGLTITFEGGNDK